MVEYGGTDTSKLGEADYRGRQAKLKAQMDLAEQTNQNLQGAGQQIHGGLTQAQTAVMQTDEAEKGRRLEAARSGLELDPTSGKYKESALAHEKRAFEQGVTFKEYELRRDKATSDVLQRQQEIGIEQQKVNQETGLKAQDRAIAQGRLNVDQQREERLWTEFNTKTGEDREKVALEWNKSADDRIEKLTDQMKQISVGNLQANKEAMATLSIAAANNPKLQLALDNIKSGQQTPDDMKQLMSTMQEARNQVALSQAANTGYISPLVDPSSPTMQQFYTFRGLYTRRMENDMTAEQEILKQLPPEQRAGFQEWLQLTPKSQAERVRLANKAAAQGYQGITMARAGAGGAQRGGQPSAGGAGQTKHGQDPLQYKWGAGSTGGKFGGESGSRGQR